mgnify:CR=1 FL=1
MLDKIKRFATTNKVTYRIIYFLFIVFEKLQSCLYLCMRIFPIKENKIVFCSARGKRYGDNPMYISDELRNRKCKYELVWLLKENVEEDMPEGIRRKKYNIFTEAYELATAKVWVDSNLKYPGTRKRKGQLYVQTWHGSYGLKKIAMDLDDKLPLIDKRYYLYNSGIIDLMISNSKRTTEIYRRAFLYKGEMLEGGSPRNDIMFKNFEYELKKVKKYFELGKQRIVLYAPTFRNNYRLDDFNIEYEKIRQTLKKRFSGEWVVLIRLHPNNLCDAEKFLNYSENIKNASQYSVMQELLVAADILITDYSSCMFDFVTTGKPCFLYATDVEKYREERDYYFELEDLPFPLAENNEQLEENILNFDEELYQKKLKELFEQVGLCETGHASEKVADYIEQWMKEN